MDEISAISAVGSGKQLTPEQEAEVKKLAERDRDVRAHEAQHLAAAGALATGVEYSYEVGPDGKLYAVAGKVRIFIPPGLTPEEMLAVARELRAAAEAPADPSSQDMAAASKANQIEAEALQKIADEHSASARTTHGTSAQAPARGLDRFA
jgi:hypothetical protein